MTSALWNSKTGLDAQQMRMTVIANNLANANTTGFKRDRAVFEDLIYQNVRQPGAQSSQDTELPTGLQLGTGVRIVATEKLFSQGNINPTDSPLDFAIQGRGFFQILLPDGATAYTRDGSFTVDSSGQLVNSSGYPMEPAITIPQGSTSISVGVDGTVSVTDGSSGTPTQVGNIQLADFINETGLQPRGENLYLETVSSGSPQTTTPGLNGSGTL
ncbi:MAG: flagellar basal-body rod protein FlgG, partial [Leptospiraceae bacterium]|nr:flagellar basal-body rod protein FlgG [Leptospiraceae bacterium]